jgi:tRNA pseudouridine13 synthase
MVLMKVINCKSGIDNKIGIYAYSTDCKGIGGKIRNNTSDFDVQELLDPQILSNISYSPTTENRFPIYILEKNGIDTPHALQEIKHKLGWRAHYLGLKDSRAKSSQFISPMNLKKPPKRIKISLRINLIFYGYLNKPLTRRNLAGNHFKIRISGIKNNIQSNNFAMEKLKQSIKENKVLNFFGYQRFGGKRPVNHLIGKNIVKGRFEEAIVLLLSNSLDFDDEEFAMMQTMIYDPSNLYDLLRNLEKGQDLERDVILSLINHPKDLVKALRAVPINIRRLLINSYQSYIFNRVLSQALEEEFSFDIIDTDDIYGIFNTSTGKIDEIKRSENIFEFTRDKKRIVPLLQLVGYTFRAGKGRFGQLTKKILEDEGVLSKQFHIKAIPEISAEGGFRNPVLQINDITWVRQEDAIHIEFTLPKGSFATVILREIMKPVDPMAAGF